MQSQTYFFLLFSSMSIYSHLNAMELPLYPISPNSVNKIFRYSPNESTHGFECQAFSYGADAMQTEEVKLWDNGLFVQIDPTFSVEETELILTALAELDKVLCVGVKVWPQNSTPTGDFAFIRKDISSGKCSSRVGKQGGEQIINIGVERCLYTNVIIHECIHALGLHHEQSRPDRDEFVTIYWNNIEPGHAFNFNKRDTFGDFDVPYDVTSIMHYSSYTFSKNKTLPTILTKDGDVIGRNHFISPFDIMKLTQLYKCY